MHLGLPSTWVLACRGDERDGATAWTWTMEPAVITLFILVVRPFVAIGFGLLCIVAPVAVAVSAELGTSVLPF